MKGLDLLNNRQKVLNKIVKQDLRDSWIDQSLGFRKTRIEDRKLIKDVDFEILVIYKNLGVRKR